MFSLKSLIRRQIKFAYAMGHTLSFREEEKYEQKVDEIEADE